MCSSPYGYQTQFRFKYFNSNYLTQCYTHIINIIDSFTRNGKDRKEWMEFQNIYISSSIFYIIRVPSNSMIRRWIWNLFNELPKDFSYFYECETRIKFFFFKSCLTSEKTLTFISNVKLNFLFIYICHCFLTYSFKSWTLHGIHFFLFL